MKKKPKLTVCIVAIVALFSGRFWSSDTGFEDPIVTPPMTTAVNVVPQLNAKTTIATQVALPESKPTIEQVAMKTNALFIAGAFAQEIQYPSYSRPLGKYDLDRLEPNFFADETILVDDNGEKVSLSLKKYRFFAPEPIELALSGNNISQATVEVRAVGEKKAVAAFDFTPSNAGWNAVVDGSEEYPEDLELLVTVSVAAKTFTLVANVKYVTPTAVIVSVDDAASFGSDMKVAVNLTVHESGLYRVRANLMDAEGAPIAHLVQKQKLSKGSQSLDLKAHVSVLKGRKAPFTLTTFSVELMSPRPGVAKRFGDSQVGSVEVDDFAIESLEDIPYQPSEKEQQRLKFLQQMAQ